MTDVNLGDVVEILDLRLSPTVRQLKLGIFRRFAIGPL